MIMEQEKPEDIVCDLNGQLYEQLNEDDNSEVVRQGFDYLSTGNQSLIRFGEFVMWDSEDQPYDYATDDYIPIRTQVLKNFETVQAEIAKIKLS